MSVTIATTISWLLLAFTSCLYASDVLPVMSSTPKKCEWQEFARMGGGYVPIPENLEPYLNDALAYAERLPEQKNAQGYAEEPALQLTMIMLNQSQWFNFPKSVRLLFEGMGTLSVQILNDVLHALDIPADDFYTITGGLSKNEGVHDGKVLYYAQEREGPSIVAHKDIRFVTVLFTKQRGLRGKLGLKDFPIDPKDGYFFVNLGVFLEALIDDPTCVTALIHYVPRLDYNRTALGVFSRGARSSEEFYQYHDNIARRYSIDHIERFKVKDPGNHFVNPQHQLGAKD